MKSIKISILALNIIITSSGFKLSLASTGAFDYLRIQKTAISINPNIFAYVVLKEKNNQWTSKLVLNNNKKEIVVSNNNPSDPFFSSSGKDLFYLENKNSINIILNSRARH